jgi:hypothetical protein
MLIVGALDKVTSPSCREREWSWQGGAFALRGPKGERSILPKGEGELLMLSAFQSRLFGFGRVGGSMTEEELFRIICRQIGQAYFSTGTAEDVNGAGMVVNKESFVATSNPLLREFRLQKRDEGYWNF